MRSFPSSTRTRGLRTGAFPDTLAVASCLRSASVTTSLRAWISIPIPSSTLSSGRKVHCLLHCIPDARRIHQIHAYRVSRSLPALRRQIVARQREGPSLGRRLRHPVGDSRAVEDDVQLERALRTADDLPTDVQPGDVSFPLRPYTYRTEEGSSSHLHRHLSRHPAVCRSLRLDHHLVPRLQQSRHLVLEVGNLFVSTEKLTVEPDGRAAHDVGKRQPDALVIVDAPGIAEASAEASALHPVLAGG